MRKRVMQTAQKTPPLVALRLKDADFTVFQLSNKHRQKGWVVPASIFPRTPKTSL
jgi:glutamate/tyrosine decarboxylase-like PLP-dependent enzyme